MTEVRADGSGANRAVVTTTETDETRADGSGADGGGADGIWADGADDAPLIKVSISCASCTEACEGFVADIGIKSAGAKRSTHCYENCGAAVVVTCGIGDRANKFDESARPLDGKASATVTMRVVLEY